MKYKYQCCDCGYEWETNKIFNSYCNSCDGWNVWRTEEKTMCKEEYEIVKPFNIKDIWDAFKENHSCPEFQREWGDLLDECLGRGSNYWRDMINVSYYKVLNKNLHHLEKKGLIKKIEKDVVLVPGMKLRSKRDGHSYKVIESGDGCRFNKISILGEGNKDTNFSPFIFDYGRTFSKNTTLKQLNSKCGWDFEVVDE